VISKYGIKNTRKKRLAYLPELRQRLSIDETAFNGELYTILTNSSKRKGTIVAMMLELKLRLS
jgi:hypothetical protein